MVRQTARKKYFLQHRNMDTSESDTGSYEASVYLYHIHTESHTNIKLHMCMCSHFHHSKCEKLL